MDGQSFKKKATFLAIPYTGQVIWTEDQPILTFSFDKHAATWHDQ